MIGVSLRLMTLVNKISGTSHIHMYVFASWLALSED